MLLPFVAWAITGVFFFIKPGYSGAYDQLSVKTYLSIKSLTLPNDNLWSEVRVFRTILGRHLIVKSNDKWLHLNADTYERKQAPTVDEITSLVNDAINVKSLRYGEVTTVDALSAITSTNIRVTLNWENMTLRQQGEDTDFINTMYKIHYLQWTGITSIDKVLGIVGLGLVLILAALGIKLSFKRKIKVRKTDKHH